MPPTEKVTRDEVIEAALAVVEAEGLPALTARRVAAELGLSTAPVYVKFESMEALAKAVMERARDLLVASTERNYTDLPFLNVGVGIAMFAKEHPRLYHALFLESDQFEPIIEGLFDHLTEDMKRDPRFTDMPRKGRRVLMERMWTYTHGLASMIAVGLARETSLEDVLHSMRAVGSAVINDALARHPASSGR